MSEFLERVRQGPKLLLDGGLGTELIARGLPPGTPPEQWTLEHPERITAVHRAYVDAGSDAVHTNTFGANAARLARHGLSDSVEAINRSAPHLAREAGAHFVLGDIGPTGEHLPPVGRGDPERWRRHFEEQGRFLAESGIDAFHVETMSDLREALIALQALQNVAPSVPTLVSLNFERKKRGFFTLMGDPPGPSFIRLREVGAAVVGANCTLKSGDMLDLSREALATTPVPLVLQPNAGKPEVTAGGIEYAQTPEEFAEDMSLLLAEQRVVALGGCCGTNPLFIAALRARMATWP